MQLLQRGIDGGDGFDAVATEIVGSMLQVIPCPFERVDRSPNLGVRLGTVSDYEERR